MVTHDVEEARLLSNRVIVFSDRPARLRADLAVDLPYPRHRDHPELLRLRRERPNRRAADETDNFAPLHCRARNVDGCNLT